MSNFLKVELDLVNVDKNILQNYNKQITYLDNILKTKTWAWNDYLGWYDVENIISKEELNEVLQTAKYLRENFEKIVVIGIWGSYLWAKASIHSLKSKFDEQKIIFAWYNLDSEYLRDLITYLQNKNYAIIVISKSWTTIEPALAFRFLLNDLNNKYSKEEVSKRVIAITDAKKWVLKELSDKNWFKTFKIADNIGWRYSVLTPVWLLPIAVEWYNVEKMLSWAVDLKKEIDNNKDIFSNPVYAYAWARNILLEKWKTIEILSNFDIKLKYIAEWWKQLFGESEGKDGKGIFPANLNYSTDLHSMWQYVQEWARNLFETFFIIEKDNILLEIPKIENDEDKLNFLSWKKIEFVNKAALYWTISAHKEWNVDVIKIIIPELNEYYLWQLIYFFERACGISAYMIWVNPFNQPWVEAYKKYMMNNLKN